MTASLRQAWAIARKEAGGYFGSPTALIFVGLFLLVTLFIFFWVETFYARNIADVRPLFRWMPVLMIFLSAVLTMRQWSEEQRGGTVELLLTMPVHRSLLVLGKFAGVMTLTGAALALTLVLPVTTSFLGDLDWGPVLGGYVASVLMTSVYVAIGLFVSSRTDNQIVSFILTAMVCGALYLAGTSGVVSLTGDAQAELLRAIGTSSRFESIERGVIDLRDLIYYVSLAAFFLWLNIVSLDMKRWSWGTGTRTYRRNVLIGVLLVGANLVALNAWLFPVSALRLDLTSQQRYSLSGTSRDLVRNLQEPLLVRGYFSERTHPLLRPLLPEIRDLMREYEAISGGAIKVEMVDPRDNEELEAEANQAYGILPTPFRITERYEASVINSYFNILVRYGDQFVTLGIQDLIDVVPAGGGNSDVKVGNLEYALTRSIKKAVFGFQSLESVIANVDKPFNLTLFVTLDALPESLRDLPQMIEKVAVEIGQESEGKLLFEAIDPDAQNTSVTRATLLTSYGLRPVFSLFTPESYYLHLLLQVGEESQGIFLGGDMTEAELRGEIEAALKRAVPGFLKTVGIWTPVEGVATRDGVPLGPASTWQLARSQLAQTQTTKPVDLTTGRVPGDVDVLVVIGPRGMSDRERFAIDQFLMRGGALVVATGNFALSPIQLRGSPVMEPVVDGIGEMLASYGIAVGNTLVMDLRNEPLPVQVERNVGGFNMVEVQEVAYPLFVDVRSDTMDKDSPIVADLPSVTLHWASPLEIDAEKNRRREVVTLLQSTDQSWLRTTLDLEPNPETYPGVGFPIQGAQGPRVLAVSVRGSFESYFKNRTSPFQAGSRQTNGEGGDETQTDGVEQELGTIEVSPQTSRLVVVGSSEFLNDLILNLSRNLSPERYLLNLQLLQNAVDWSVEDEDLLAIRSRGTYTRLLKPLEPADQAFWEWLNYGVAVAALIVIGAVWHFRQRRETPMPLVDVESGDGE